VMSLGVGLSAGYTVTSARAPTTQSMCPGAVLTNGTCPAGTSSSNPNQWTLSGESTAINVVPVTAVVVGRFDGLARHFQYIPLVPYAKFGPAYSFWWVATGTGLAHNPDGRDAVGGSLGWHGALGIQLMLDAFEPRVARQLDTNWGVNHSYLFFEGYITDLRGLTSRPQLDVGTTNWAAGLMVEF
jgi:hypothetical protein